MKLQDLSTSELFTVSLMSAFSIYFVLLLLTFAKYSKLLSYYLLVCRRPDGSLAMKLVGDNFHVTFFRHKKQQIYRWKGKEEEKLVFNITTIIIIA